MNKPQDPQARKPGSTTDADRSRPDRTGSGPDETESVVGEEDPGSSLEQFTDLMHEAPAQRAAPADDGTLAPRQGDAARREPGGAPANPGKPRPGS
jgi:hypothetical protein